jgi:hypothetical protein
VGSSPIVSTIVFTIVSTEKVPIAVMLRVACSVPVGDL